MGIQEFLNKNKVIGLTEEVAISNRICDEKGVPLKFKVKTISSKDYDDLKNRNMVLNPVGNEFTFSTAGFQIDLIINCCVEPNFKNKENIDAVGVSTPKEYVNAVLLPGEIERLADKISMVNGYKPFNELVEEAKN